MFGADGGVRREECDDCVVPFEGAEGEQEVERAEIDDEDDPRDEDCEPMRRAPRPYQPTPKEIEDHKETHYPP